MAEPSLDFIGRQLQSIQAELQQIKFAADIDRRNRVSRYENFVAALGVKIGAFEMTVEHRPNAVTGELGAVRGELGAVRGELGAVRGELGALRDELVARFDRIEQLLNRA